ncbi:MAG: SAM-dependent methyltransferase [Clostridiales bacterium]|jgi:tRNA (cmo5U34)-methyltransferase|nr:SAM-dependent methyltransferase [Clostridiales bacterium]
MSNETSNKPEEMASFFNKRANGYEEHMKETVESFDKYYISVSNSIDNTQDVIEILDIGCGTGLEIEGILKKAPNARITCIDMSEGMLDLLKEKYKGYMNQLNIITGSYVELPFGEENYDYVVSVMTMHHWKYNEKKEIYIKIKNALKNGGKYIEGDYYVALERERELLDEYHKEINKYKLSRENFYHLDIPFAIETQKRLFNEVGFNQFEIVWKIEEQIICVME